MKTQCFEFTDMKFKGHEESGMCRFQHGIDGFEVLVPRQNCPDNITYGMVGVIHEVVGDGSLSYHFNHPSRPAIAHPGVFVGIV